MIYRTNVLESLTGDETIPDPYQSWYDLMVDYIDRLKVDSEYLLGGVITSDTDGSISKP